MEKSGERFQLNSYAIVKNRNVAFFFSFQSLNLYFPAFRVIEKIQTVFYFKTASRDYKKSLSACRYCIRPRVLNEATAIFYPDW